MMKKSILKLFIFSICGFCLFVVVLFFLFRNSILSYLIEKKQEKLFLSSGYKLSFTSCTFTGINKINLNDIFIGKNSTDTLLFADSIYLDLSLGAILTGRIKLNNLELNKVSFYYPKKQITGKISLHSQKLSAMDFFIYLKKYFPSFIKINEGMLHFFYKDNYYHAGVYAFKKDNSYFNSKLEYITGNDVKKYEIEGKWNNKDSIHFKLYERDTSWALLPFAYSAKVKTDSVLVDIFYRIKKDTTSQININLTTYNPKILHPELSTTSVKMNTAGIDLNLSISKRVIEIEENSSLDINGIRILVSGKIQTLPLWKFKFKINSDHWEADQFFTRLPYGLFKTVNTLEADGKLNYMLYVEYASNNTDNLIFESELGKENFKIKSFGKTDLLKLNTDFNYTIFEKEKEVKTLMLSNANPDFTPIGQISTYLKNAILTSEDGNFFYHHGFNPEAFRKSIITNIQKGRFARGGSTITMQLVKNIFLNREKTISRKLEEAMLVWLIEQNHLVSKERMFEIYLNMIEWGPGIYGVKESSYFYFRKSPALLTLSESIFMASVIPHPKYFKYCFDTSGTFKKYMQDYYKVCTEFMSKKQLISEEEFLNLKPEVKLTGAARLYVLPKNVVPEEDQGEGVME